jgi:hypothetical protein
MNSQDFRSLQEAYMEVVENQQLDEGYQQLGFRRKLKMMSKSRDLKNRAEKNVRDAASRSGHDSTETRVAIENGVKDMRRGETITNVMKSHNPQAAKSKESKNRSGIKVKKSGNTISFGSGLKKEQVDIYDIILSHLLDEGYAETPEAAKSIMVNMSEEWRDSIIG